MNVDQMQAALKGFGALMGGADGVTLNKFARLFEGLGKAKVTTVVTQVLKNWEIDKRVKKRPADLERALCCIRDTLTSINATTQANIFGKVLVLLEGTDNQDIDSFVADAISARCKRAKQNKSRKATKPKFADAQAPDIGLRLTAAAHQRALFDAFLNELEAAYKPAELKAIALCFMGYDVGKTRKADIIKAMRNWQREAELNDDLHAAQAKHPV